ncbi:DUF4301 family protein [Fulvivirgaceae bacterium BMA12]|uniref:DUF4301 family protein n=1 Tax=Agaribacillus aureus TaxID=3051825 RepID=A0ABT8L300_9BACT|nr:DUF4301 family protein [Fulvivirgaceae bacterium BMA12]
MLTAEDIEQLGRLNINESDVIEQVNAFKTGFPYLPVQKAATVGDGIVRLEDNEINDLVAHYENMQSKVRIIKFVPASGAASRMFKDLFAFLNETGPQLNDHQAVARFFEGISDFAFANDLAAVIEKSGASFESVLNGQQYQSILSYVLTDKGLNYGNLPKGLIKFHKYGATSRVAAEEHLMEGINYGQGNKNSVVIHFTVSPEHLPLFKDMAEKASHQWPEIQFEISFSEQKTATNTIAVDMNNEPFRERDNSILFRPGGHGALLSNLNDLEAEIIFIKNIDNVVPDKIKDTTYRYKKALAGLLLNLREKISFHMQQLAAGEVGEETIEEAQKFLEDALNYKLPETFGDFDPDEKISYLQSRLNRPTRICGMVKNEGEPGGGPFWVENADGSRSLQIAETSQLDMGDPAIATMVQQSTHFNPVDLICSNVDFEGRKFDLMKYRDPSTGFITEKSKDGKKLKAQELPGLWNGAMADWNTVFVEVPIITFNPVKTVNDLLRPQHQ